MPTKTRRRRRRNQLPAGFSAPLDLTQEEVLADLDPGWPDWEPAKEAPGHSSRAA